YEEDRPHDRREIAERSLRAEAILAAERLEHRLEPRQRAQHDRGERLGQRRLRARYDERGIEPALDAETVACRAGTVRAVEGEEARRELGIGDAADRTRVPLAEAPRARPPG